MTPLPLRVEPARRGAYLRRMPAAGLLRILVLVAVLLAPLAMIVPAAQALPHHMAPAAHSAPYEAMAHPGHGEDGTKPEPAARDCAMSCAAIPAFPASGAEPLVPPRAAAEPAFAMSALSGLHPEAATPPPRFS